MVAEYVRRVGNDVALCRKGFIAGRLHDPGCDFQTVCWDLRSHGCVVKSQCEGAACHLDGTQSGRMAKADFHCGSPAAFVSSPATFGGGAMGRISPPTEPARP